MSDKNIFMTALSNINLRNFKKLNYAFRDENGKLVEEKSYPGYFSGEPGIRCAIDDLLEQGLLFDKYVIFCSPKTIEQVDISEIQYDSSGKILRGGMERADKDIYQNYISGIQGFDYDTDKNEVVEKSVSFENISAYDYIEMIIRERIYKAITDGKKEQITSWMRTNGYCESTGVVNEEVIEEYIKAACRIDNGKPIIMDDNPDIEVIKRNIESQQSVRNDKMNIYIDITGGTRITSVVAMLMSRWYEQNQMAEVKKVFYSSIMKGEEAVIIDWTRNYELFKIADSKSDLMFISLFSEENSRINDCLKKEELSLDLIDRYYKDAGKKLSDDKIVKQKAYLEKSRMILEDDIEIATSLQGLSLVNMISSAINRYDKTALSNSVSEYKEQKKTNNKEAKPDVFIKKFHEGIIGSLCEKKILSADNENENIADIIKCMNWYYRKDDNKRFKSGVVYFVLDMCKYLNSNINESPSNHYKNLKKLDNKLYKDKFDGKREPRFQLKGANYVHNEFFINELKNKKISLYKKFEIKSIDDVIEYEVLRNIYFNQGFPFAFITTYGKICEDVKVYYLKTVNEFVDNLEKLYISDKAAYKDELKNCMDVEYIQFLIPEYSLPECIKVDKSKVGGDENKCNEFISGLKELREEARLFRNAEAHPDDSKFDIYRGDDKLEALADKILAWLEKCKDDFGIDLM